MYATLAEAPVDLLERADVVDKMGDARRGLVEYSTTPGAAVAGLIALVARYAQLAGGAVITGVALGPAAALVITAATLVARFGERGAQARYSLLEEPVSGGPAQGLLHPRRRQFARRRQGDPGAGDAALVAGAR